MYYSPYHKHDTPHSRSTVLITNTILHTRVLQSLSQTRYSTLAYYSSYHKHDTPHSWTTVLITNTILHSRVLQFLSQTRYSTLAYYSPYHKHDTPLSCTTVLITNTILHTRVLQSLSQTWYSTLAYYSSCHKHQTPLYPGYNGTLPNLKHEWQKLLQYVSKAWQLLWLFFTPCNCYGTWGEREAWICLQFDISASYSGPFNSQFIYFSVSAMTSSSDVIASRFEHTFCSNNYFRVHAFN